MKPYKKKKLYHEVTPRSADIHKVVFLVLCIALALVLRPNISNAQSFSRTITRQAAFADKSNPANKFIVRNINGSVTIEAYDGDTVELTVKEEIKGRSGEIEKAKKELSYKLVGDGNLIYAYPKAPFITVSREGDDLHFCVKRDDDDSDYRFKDDVTVRVPRDITVDGATINKGKVAIIGIFRKVEASNVNGEVELHHITSETHVSTVNGDITIDYDRSPDGDSEYHTINGTIDVYMPDNLSADVYFQSLHGDLYTDFNDVQRLKPQLSNVSHSKASGIMYHVDKTTPIRIGEGGPKLQFKVLNGDVYIRKQS